MGSALADSSCMASHLGVQAPETFEIIDCHTHFYDPGRAQGVPWPPKDSTLYRTVLPKDLRDQPMHQKITGTVIVEASEWIEIINGS